MAAGARQNDHRFPCSCRWFDLHRSRFGPGDATSTASATRTPSISSNTTAANLVLWGRPSLGGGTLSLLRVEDPTVSVTRPPWTHRPSDQAGGARCSEPRRLCEVTDTATREAVLNLCRQSRERGWWVRYRDVLSPKFVGFEAEASTIYNWELAVIPGLLQVPAYTELISQTALVRDPKDVQRVVDARIERQRVMFDDPPDLWFVFDETALVRLRHHPEVLHAQVAQLIEASEHPSVTIQIVSHDRLHPGTGGPFVIMDFPSTVDPSIVYLETDTDGLYLEEPDEITRYRKLFDHLRLAALLPEDSVVRLREMTT